MVFISPVDDKVKDNVLRMSRDDVPLRRGITPELSYVPL